MKTHDLGATLHMPRQKLRTITALYPLTLFYVDLFTQLENLVFKVLESSKVSKTPLCFKVSQNDLQTKRL